MKVAKFLIWIMLLLSTNFGARAFLLERDSIEKVEPIVTITSDDGGVNVEYIFPGVFLQEDNIFMGTYTLGIPGFGNNITEAEPSWPVHYDSFEIPYGCGADVEIVVHETVTKNMRLSPARTPLAEDIPTSYSKDNILPIAQYDGFLPKSPVSNEGIQIYRDRGILYVGILPVSYNMSEGFVNLTQKLTYRVAFTSTKQRVKKPEESLMTTDENLMSTMFTYVLPQGCDSQSGMQKTVSATRWSVGAGYLILTTSRYASAVNTLASWKRQLGYNVRVITNDSWTVSAIKTSIKEACEDNANTQYLLLFGDEIDIPAEMIDEYSSLYKFYSDFKYACLDGENDYLDDLSMGRLSVTTLDEANVVVDKIIAYDKKCHISNNALFCAEFSDYDINDGYEDRRFVRTCEDIIDGITQLGWNSNRVYFYKNNSGASNANPVVSRPQNWNNGIYSYGEKLPDLLLSNSFNWKGNSSDILNAINSGVGIVLHRDHGAIQYWASPRFDISNINALSNGNKTPIIFSMNCLTGMFQYLGRSGLVKPTDLKEISEGVYRSTCFAEAFLRKNNGGCVGIFAASQTSYSGFNDVLTMEMFQNIWPKVKFTNAFPNYSPSTASRSSVKKMGDVLKVSKQNLSKYYKPTASKNRYTNQIFHWFGDPTTEIHENKILVSPNLSIEKLQSESLSVHDPSVKLLTGEIVQLSKVNKTTFEVYNSTGNQFYLTNMDLAMCNFYISGDRIVPQQIKFTLALSEAKLTNVIQENDVLKVSYQTNDDISHYSIGLVNVETGNSQIHQSNGTDKNVISISNLRDGIYVIQLIEEGEIVDTSKIVIK